MAKFKSCFKLTNQKTHSCITGVYNRVSQYRKTAKICALVRQLRAFFSQTATVSLLAMFTLLLLLLLILTLS